MCMLNFKALHAAGNASVSITSLEFNEHEWECDWVWKVLPLNFSLKTPWFVIVGGVGSGGSW